ncbi:MAG: nucleotidyltransferase family protein [Candidatus Sulfotelmatobacter sp.]
MKAMILAAGLGTRLRPLTNDRPKALVEVGGRTLLEITLARLREFQINEVIVNVHHFADIVVDYLKANNNFGMHIEISREETLLDTGGGLKKAAWFFLQDSIDSRESPFIVHNVDVISTIDLKRMLQFHKEGHALATLAVQERETSRYLLFDQDRRLCGRRAGRDGEPEMVGELRPASGVCALGFSGIHAISPRIFSLMTEDGAFSIISTYLRLAAQGENISAFRADEYCWRDLGRPENIERAQAETRKR